MRLGTGGKRLAGRGTADAEGRDSARQGRCRQQVPPLLGPSPQSAALPVQGRYHVERPGGSLIAIDLTQQTGDDCYRGRVFFFTKETFLTSTKNLKPDSVGGVKGVRADGTAKFAVVYWVSASANTSCAQNGNAGTDTYVYGWNGHHMFKKSGTRPKLPKVIVGA